MTPTYPTPIANKPGTVIWLTLEQRAAVINRDQLLAKDLGINFDCYMSLIDPDYPG